MLKFISKTISFNTVSSAIALLFLGTQYTYSHGAHRQPGHDWDILLPAIEQGNIRLVKKIVPQKIKAYEQTKGGRYLFAIARFHHQQAIADYLAWQAIIPAIERGNVAVVKEIIDKGFIAPDAKTKGSRSLLQVAKHHHQQALVDYLQSRLKPQPADTARIIEFYNNNTPYYEFTNFYQGKPIVMNGTSWPTSEHYFQAMKFVGPREIWIQEVIRKANTARQVFDLANSRTGTYKNFIRSDWDAVKDAIMYKILQAKFTQDPRLSALLLNTGSAKLIEASPVDSYWGYGPDKKGKNMLGKLLMQLRNELKQVKIKVKIHETIKSNCTRRRNKLLPRAGG